MFDGLTWFEELTQLIQIFFFFFFISYFLNVGFFSIFFSFYLIYLIITLLWYDLAAKPTSKIIGSGIAAKPT
jgi:hypothetical protein